MLRSTLLIMALAVMLSGCIPAKILVGVREPDLADVKPGIPRADAEKILGDRYWHVGTGDGLTYDIYQYEQEKAPNPLLAAIGLGVDYITVGLLELCLSVSDLEDFELSSQVVVAYDAQDLAVFVSKPWEALFVGPCRRQRQAVPANSGVPANVRPSPQKGLAVSKPDFAKFDDKIRAVETIDGRVPEEYVVELPPGRHLIRYYHGDVAEVELMPGRLYRLTRKSYCGYARSNPFYYLEDVDSGEVLHCNAP